MLSFYGRKVDVINIESQEPNERNIGQREQNKMQEINLSLSVSWSKSSWRTVR